MLFYYIPFISYKRRNSLDYLSPLDYLCVHLSDIIVDTGGLPYNLERFNYFISNFDNKIGDNIRVIELTIEGDPIISDIEYDGQTIKMKVDTSYDKWGSYGISYYTGTRIQKEEDKSIVRYNLYDDNDKYVHDLIGYRKFKLL